MEILHYARRLNDYNPLRLPLFRLLNHRKQKFECPVCGYNGPFMDLDAPTGVRKHAKCPRCSALERHRIQYLVITSVLRRMDAAKMRMLHFAPEPFFRSRFTTLFGKYETADLARTDVDHNVDIQALPFDDAVYDFVFASHVLEHVPDDIRAIKEIRRVLRPKGIAMLPVPLLCERTIEYPSPNPNETYHVRAPGMDYFERFERYFSSVEKNASDSLPEKYQVYIYEDRTIWPSPECPLRPSMTGERHVDVVPVCYA